MVDLSTEPFHRTLNRVVERRTTALKLRKEDVAHQVGMEYRNFMNLMEYEQRYCPARILPQLCTILKDYELLDCLEREVHRVAFSTLHESDQTAAADVRAVQGLVKEVGQALGELAKTLEDGVVEAHELEQTIPALDSVIRECGRLKHWLQHRHRLDLQRRTKG